MPAPLALDRLLATAEFLAVDTETNGRAGADCEVTEVAAVLVGGGELHERWATLARTQAPLGRGIQRFTGISQTMVDAAPDPRETLPDLAARLEGRVLVAHSAAFDSRVLRQAFDRAGLAWPDPPVLCTVALARRLLPLQRRRGLGLLAAALGIEVSEAHRALPDAETCARVLCALFPRLCAHASTVGEALALLRPRREARARPPRRGRPAGARRARPELDFGELPRDPGVYLFRDARGRVLYVGKSVSVRSRARAHFAPSSAGGEWTAQAELVDYAATTSELGALLLESRLVKELRPPGNVRLRSDPREAWISCRLEEPFPVLEVGGAPAPGRAVNVGPLSGRRAAEELAGQLASLYGLRHCGRRLKLRPHASAYGQMGRCLAPCLGDLDPNLYRTRLDAALAVFATAEDGRVALLDHVETLMRSASRARAYERAAALRRRRARLEVLLERLTGPLRAAHEESRLVLARHPARPAWEAITLAAGRVEIAPLTSRSDLEARVARAARRAAEIGVPSLPPAEAGHAGIVLGWLESHPDTPALTLRPAPAPARLAALLRAAGAASSEGELDDLGADVLAAAHGEQGSRLGLAAHERERDRPVGLGDDGGAEDADRTLAEPDLRPGRRRRRETQPAQVPVRPAAMEQPGHGLLPDVAALGEGDGPFVQTRLLGDDAARVEVDPVARAARLDPERLGLGLVKASSLLGERGGDAG